MQGKTFLYNFEAAIALKASLDSLLMRDRNTKLPWYFSLYIINTGHPVRRKTILCWNIFAGCQTSIAQKSQETQCTLLKEFFTTSTPIQSDEELSDNEEEMEQDDDPSYVPDPKEIDADDNDDTGFDDFDDCLYE